MTRPQSAVRRHGQRSEPKGDARRAALLHALDQLLEDQALSQIEISDITNKAGVSRSAFYFYFPRKAVAVAEIMGDMYEDMLSATADWYECEGRPHEFLRAGMRRTAHRWRRRAGLMVAMLDAVGSDVEVRSVWESWVQRFTERGAERIGRDIDLGFARAELDPVATASVLVGATFRAMEHDVRSTHAGQRPSEAYVDALIDVWIRSVYKEPE